MTVGIVVVSHSEALATAAVELATQMLEGGEVAIEIAAGVDGGGLGTDAMRVKEAVETADDGAGVLVLVDMGSALLSTDLALELLDDPAVGERVTVTSAPLVEGLVVAAVAAAGGASLAEVDAEARDGLAGKQAQLGDTVPAADPTSTDGPGRSDGAADDGAGGEVSGVFVVANPHGLHARPAARLVAEVRGLDARIELRDRTTGTGPASAFSLVRLAALGARAGDEIEVRASGPAADEALARVLALAEQRFGEATDTAPAGAPATSPRPPTGAGGPRAASPGIAVGPARQLRTPRVAVDDLPDATGGPDDERHRLATALARVRDEIAETRDLSVTTSGPEAAGVFDAHLALLDDPDVGARVDGLLEQGRGAAQAWAAATGEAEEALAALDDDYLRARAADVDAVAQQVLHVLVADGSDRSPEAPSPDGIVVARDLTPAEAARLDPEVVDGVVLADGAPTSHAAVLARSRGIPMVVGAGDAVLDLADGVTVALDGSTAELRIDPDAPTLERLRHRAAAEAGERLAELADSARDAVTTDGLRLLVGVNVGSAADADAGRTAGADLAGLVRTEFLFLDRDTAPDLDEQEAAYAAIADALDGRPATLRTLDVGGDKPLGYLPQPTEVNPFLGLRGVRLGLADPDLTRTQLEAMARVARRAPVRVMVPMVATPAELLGVRRILDSVLDDLVDRLGPGTAPELGIMVEVPAAALKIAAFAPHVDFVSIGTNDLTQYTLAAERGNPAVADLGDPLDPAVLRLVDHVAATLATAGPSVEVGVCGEAAADPDAVPLLVGLGVHELSVGPSAVARVKAQVRTLDTTACRALALGCLDEPDAAAVRRRVREQGPGVR